MPASRKSCTLSCIALSVLCLLSFSGALFTTVSSLTTIRNSDRRYQTIGRIEDAVNELELFSHRMLVSEFSIEVFGEFLEWGREFQTSVSAAITPGLDDEISIRLNNLNNETIPGLMNLYNNLQMLTIHYNSGAVGNVPLIARSFLDDSNPEFSRALEKVIEDTSFFITDVTSQYRQITNEAGESLMRHREAAFRQMSFSFILYPLAIVFLLAIVATRGIQFAKIAESEALERNANLEELVHLRTAYLEQQNKELIEARSLLVEREKMAALGQLVAGVAHEVNTPLGVSVTAVSFLSDLLNTSSEEPIDRDVFKETTGLILSNLQRASKLIDGFKRVAVDETGEMVRQFNLVSYLSGDLLPSLESLLHKKQHKLQLTGTDTLVMKKNPGDFAQIVTNLVINASIHGYGSDQPGIIRIGVEKNENSGILTVSDSGKGMNTDVRNHMYDPFFTTNRESGGSGLGLMLVYNLVNQKLKGRIDCETALGKGTTFTVRFPL